MVSLEETPDGTVLCVKAHAGSRKNGVTGIHDGALRIAVNQIPEKGKANLAIINVLAEAFGLRKNQIELLSGQTSNHKRFLIRGILGDELRSRIAKHPAIDGLENRIDAD